MKSSTLTRPKASVLVLADDEGPIAPEPRSERSEPRLQMDAPGPVAATSARVLIADDDDELRATIRELLEDQGFLVVGEAADGADAVAKTVDLQPDVVLMDLRMPRVDGVEATRLIKDRLPFVQVVMLSAYGDPGLVEGSQEAGVYAYLVKGCPAQMIRDVLSSAYSFKVGLVAREREHWRTHPAPNGE